MLCGVCLIIQLPWCGRYPLALPAPNELIPTNFTLVEPGVPASAAESVRLAALNALPLVIRQDDRWTVWHKTDRFFGQPKIYAIFSLSVSSEKYDAAFVMLSKLFAACFVDSLNEYLYGARLAGLGFQLEFTSRGVQVVLSGFSDKLPLFASRVLTALKVFLRVVHYWLPRFQIL